MFGHHGPVEWRQPDSVEWLIGLRHAEVQHAFAARVRELIRAEPGLTQAAISRGGTNPPSRSGALINYKRLNDCLNGHRALPLTDMGRIEAVTGPILFGLEIERTVIEDEKLRARFPNAVGELPTAVKGTPEAAPTRRVRHEKS